MEGIKYSSPEESQKEGEMPQHRFELMVDGACIGAAEIDYFSQPLPLYQVSDLYVDIPHQGKGYASELMGQIEAWLRSRHKPGILVNAILEGSPAEGMYERRGWRAVPNSLGLYVYNWPDNVDLSILKGYPHRQRDILERKGGTI